MSEPLSSKTADPLVSVTGYVAEVGLITEATQDNGATLVCGDRYIQITGLDKVECRKLAALLREDVILRIARVAKP